MATMKSFGELVELSTLQPSRLSGEIMLEANIGDTFGSLDVQRKYPYSTDELTEPPNEAEELALNALIKQKPGRVLDIGAGYGRVSLWLQTRGIDVTSCEPDGGFVAVCTASGLRDVRQEYLHEINGLYDACILFGGGIFATDEIQDVDSYINSLLDKVLQITRPKGYFLLGTMEYNSEMLFGETKTVIASMRFRQDEFYTPYSFYLYPPKDEIVGLLEGKNAKLYQDWIIPNDAPQVNFKWISMWQKG